MRFLLFLLHFSLAFLQGWCQCGTVIKVHDGDTFEIALAKDETLKVRVAYIDTPELGQPFGLESKNFTYRSLFNKKACIEVKYKDPYGRSVAWVQLANGKILNEELLRNGLAWHFKRYSHDGALQELEDLAHRKKIGIWSTLEPTAPWEWRKEHRVGYHKLRK